jgi:hypothetical protein
MKVKVKWKSILSSFSQKKSQLNDNKRALYQNSLLLCAQMVMEIIRTFIALRFTNSSPCMIYKMILMLQFIKNRVAKNNL